MIDRRGQVWKLNVAGFESRVFLIVDGPSQAGPGSNWWYHPVVWLSGDDNRPELTEWIGRSNSRSTTAWEESINLERVL